MFSTATAFLPRMTRIARMVKAAATALLIHNRLRFHASLPFVDAKGVHDRSTTAPKPEP